MKKYKILAINPGSTSTKIALYENEVLIKQTNLHHTIEELQKLDGISEQFEFRKQIVVDTLSKSGHDIKSVDVVIGRGGLLKPIHSGVYEVNEPMVRDLMSGQYGVHAANLGGLLALDIARRIGVKAYIADPVVVDELCDVARVTGLPQIERRSVFHALNQKAVARKYAAQNGLKYDDLNLIVVHLGGGISIGAHHKGEVVDVNNALDGDGPFSPERSGSLPVGDFVDLATSGEYTNSQLRAMITGHGGIVAHLNTNDVREVEEAVRQGDLRAKLILDAMAYNVSKCIGAKAVVLKGRVDAIILTGGIAHSEYVCNYVKSMTSYIADVVVSPGENELEALAYNALMALNGKIEVMQYE